MDFWLIGFDVDGMILLQDEIMSFGVLEVIGCVWDVGYFVMIVIGCSWMVMCCYVEELGLIVDYVVCFNGVVMMC